MDDDDWDLAAVDELEAAAIAQRQQQHPQTLHNNRSWRQNAARPESGPPLPAAAAWQRRQTVPSAPDGTEPPLQQQQGAHVVWPRGSSAAPVITSWQAQGGTGRLPAAPPHYASARQQAPLQQAQRAWQQQQQPHHQQQGQPAQQLQPWPSPQQQQQLQAKQAVRPAAGTAGHPPARPSIGRGPPPSWQQQVPPTSRPQAGNVIGGGNNSSAAANPPVRLSGGAAHQQPPQHQQQLQQPSYQQPQQQLYQQQQQRPPPQQPYQHQQQQQRQSIQAPAAAAGPATQNKVQASIFRMYSKAAPAPAAGSARPAAPPHYMHQGQGQGQGQGQAAQQLAPQQQQQQQCQGPPLGQQQPEPRVAFKSTADALRSLNPPSHAATAAAGHGANPQPQTGQAPVLPVAAAQNPQHTVQNPQQHPPQQQLPPPQQQQGQQGVGQRAGDDMDTEFYFPASLTATAPTAGPVAGPPQQQQQQQQYGQQQQYSSSGHQPAAPAPGGNRGPSEFPGFPPRAATQPRRLHQQSLSFAQRPPSQQQPRDQREQPWQPAFGMPGGGSGTGDELTPTDGACLGSGGDAGWEFMLDGSGGDAGDNLITVPTTTGGIRLHRVCARHWVFPKGVSQRRYQLACIKTALLTNALVCLPTGLGKTLIAAVVMHNFARWFPEGKVVFVAPTKPLVAQQVDACHSFMGMSRGGFCELTGNVKAETRQAMWQGGIKRVFFCTPQTFWNDVKNGICPFEQVVCLVVDECHRATGNMDIVLAVKHMRDQKCKFRVLGLSATPGADGSKVQEVINHLMIAAIEFRTEQDSDVAPYTHQKVVEPIVVRASREAEQLRPMLVNLIRQAMAPLLQLKVFEGNPNPDSVASFSLLNCRQKNEGRGLSNFWTPCTQSMTLARTRETLEKFGVCQALKYVQGKLGDGYMRSLVSNPQFCNFKQALEAVVRSGGSCPKLAVLVHVLLQHFNAPTAEGEECGRVMVFTNNRLAVTEICEALEVHAPIITAKSFIGQGGGAKGSGGGGMKQKEQKAVLDGFRNGAFNCLVATCIGEEGLDIPQVDLIVCYDATASPTRSMQRMGRTGRHKDGRVVYLLAEGKEEEQYKQIEENTKALHRKLRNPRGFDLYRQAPRMLPHAYEPVRMDVAVEHTPEKEAPLKPSGRGRGSGKAASGRGGRGSGRGRGIRRASGRGIPTVDSDSGDETAAAGNDGEGTSAGRGSGAGAAPRDEWRFEPVAEAADDFEALLAVHGPAGGLTDGETAAGVAGSSGKKRKRRPQAGSGGGSRAKSRARAASAQPIEVVVISDDEEEEEDAELASAGLRATAAAAAAAAAAAGSDGADDAAAAAAAAAAAVGSGRGSGGAGASVSAAAGALTLNDEIAGGSPGATPPHSPQPSGDQQSSRRESSPLPQPAIQHRLLFPEQSAATVSWDAAGQLSIAPPPTLEALLAAVATASSGQQQQAAAPASSQGAVPAAGGAVKDGAGAEVVRTPPRVQQQQQQQQALLAPQVTFEGLLLRLQRQQPPGCDAAAGAADCGREEVQQQLVRFDDQPAHRWAFLAACGAEEAASSAPVEQQAALATAGGGDAALVPVAPAVQPAAGATASAAVAGKKASKPSRSRKRKPAGREVEVGAASAAAEVGGKKFKKRKSAKSEAAAAVPAVPPSAAAQQQAVHAAVPPESAAAAADPPVQVAELPNSPVTAAASVAMPTLDQETALEPPPTAAIVALAAAAAASAAPAAAAVGPAERDVAAIAAAAGYDDLADLVIDLVDSDDDQAFFMAPAGQFPAAQALPAGPATTEHYRHHHHHHHQQQQQQQMSQHVPPPAPPQQQPAHEQAAVQAPQRHQQQPAAAEFQQPEAGAWHAEEEEKMPLAQRKQQLAASSRRQQAQQQQQLQQGQEQLDSQAKQGPDLPVTAKPCNQLATEQALSCSQLLSLDHVTLAVRAQHLLQPKQQLQQQQPQAQQQEGQAPSAWQVPRHAQQQAQQQAQQVQQIPALAGDCEGADGNMSDGGDAGAGADVACWRILPSMPYSTWQPPEKQQEQQGLVFASEKENAVSCSPDVTLAKRAAQLAARRAPGQTPPADAAAAVPSPHETPGVPLQNAAPHSAMSRQGQQQRVLQESQQQQRQQQQETPQGQQRRPRRIPRSSERRRRQRQEEEAEADAEAAQEQELQRQRQEKGMEAVAAKSGLGSLRAKLLAKVSAAQDQADRGEEDETLASLARAKRRQQQQEARPSLRQWLPPQQAETAARQLPVQLHQALQQPSGLKQAGNAQVAIQQQAAQDDEEEREVDETLTSRYKRHKLAAAVQVDEQDVPLSKLKRLKSAQKQTQAGTGRGAEGATTPAGVSHWQQHRGPPPHPQQSSLADVPLRQLAPSPLGQQQPYRQPQQSAQPQPQLQPLQQPLQQPLPPQPSHPQQLHPQQVPQQHPKQPLQQHLQHPQQQIPQQPLPPQPPHPQQPHPQQQPPGGSAPATAAAVAAVPVGSDVSWEDDWEDDWEEEGSQQAPQSSQRRPQQQPQLQQSGGRQSWQQNQQRHAQQKTGLLEQQEPSNASFTFAAEPPAHQAVTPASQMIGWKREAIAASGAARQTGTAPSSLAAGGAASCHMSGLRLHHQTSAARAPPAALAPAPTAAEFADSQATPEWQPAAAVAGGRRRMMVVDSQTPEWQVAAGPAAAARGRLGATAWDQPLTESPASLPPSYFQQQAAGGNLRRLQKRGSAPAVPPAESLQQQEQQQQAARQQPQGRQQQLEAAQDRQRRREEARKRAARFVDCEAALSGDDASGDDGEGCGEDGMLSGFIDDGTQAPPSTDCRAYQPPPLRLSGASPSPMAAFRGLMQRRRRQEEWVQDTPGAERRGGHGRLGLEAIRQLPAGYQDADQEDVEEEYDLEDSFLAQESEALSETLTHEDHCAACGSDQGELLCCDACPSVYHTSCCGLAAVPTGNWYCPVCADGQTPDGGTRPGVHGKRKKLHGSTAKTGWRDVDGLQL
ncbi:hypothetical protein D9Q98_010131 [Chlorella vulgaris]|uniref:Uncharacterized protein n=1 Tax=Chlorella vulgaris TaxID=3077 RepID=A0A9D4YWE6_CHLVU|nr:hypothetical protein D9Q98_010131 [Chlorella vulgaris]